MKAGTKTLTQTNVRQSISFLRLKQGLRHKFDLVLI